MLSTRTRVLLWILSFALAITVKAQKSPGPRRGHCSFTYLNELYIFGGEADPGAPLFSKIALPLKSSTNDSDWINLPVNGSHNIVDGACIATSRGFAIFIGIPSSPFPSSSNSLPSNSLPSSSLPSSSPSFNEYPGIQTYDLTNNTWYAVPQFTVDLDLKVIFAQRRGHSIARRLHWIVVFGGYIGSPDNRTNDTFILDTFNRVGWIWSSVDSGPNSNAPPPNLMTTLVSANKSVLAFASSLDANNTLQNNVIYSLDVYNQRWKPNKSVLGTHYSVINVAAPTLNANDSVFLIPSGHDVNDLQQMENQKIYNLWQLNASENTVVPLIIQPGDPLPRVGASFSTKNDTIFMYGGYNGVSLSEFWSYNMSSRSWFHLNPPPPHTNTTITTNSPPTETPVPGFPLSAAEQTALIVVGSLIALILLAIIVGIILYCCRRRRPLPRPRETRSTTREITSPSNVTPSPVVRRDVGSRPPSRPSVVVIGPPAISQPPSTPDRQASFSSRFKEVLPVGSTLSPRSLAEHNMSLQDLSTPSSSGSNCGDSVEPSPPVVFRRSW